MKKLKAIYYIILKSIINIFLIIFISKNALSNDIFIEIDGNNYTDDDVILSLLSDTPKELTEEYSNYIIKTLDNSQLFEDVSVRIEDNKYIISINEFSNINKIYFDNNERLKDEELLEIVDELNLTNLNPISINKFIFEIKKIYESFGYNNMDISYIKKMNKDANIADLYFDINEGKITKINKIYFKGNDILDNQILKNSGVNLSYYTLCILGIILASLITTNIK
ncbi:MAG: hypothetical protein CBD97_02815, partial [Pelagibacteraceae bacterium TMED237]